jgi:hypothetical protein
MYDHKHDATLALNRHITQFKHLHLALANLSHLHGSAFALPTRHTCDAATDTNASTSRSIIRVLSGVGDAAGVNGEMGYTSTAACLPGGFQQAADGVLDRFLGRYAHQIESLVLGAFSTKPSPLLDLPSGFWAQFSALRLLGLEYETVERKEWSGWSIVPPPTHPCRYLVCRSRLESLMLPVFLRSRWTWHDGVRLVVGYRDEGQYCVWKNVHNRLELNTERNDGILPEF